MKVLKAFPEDLIGHIEEELKELLEKAQEIKAKYGGDVPSPDIDSWTEGLREPSEEERKKIEQER